MEESLVESQSVSLATDEGPGVCTTWCRSEPKMNTWGSTIQCTQYVYISVMECFSASASISSIVVCTSNSIREPDRP